MPADPTALPTKILFMDDEPDVCRIGQLVLTHLGYETVVVPHGEAAVHEFHQARAAGQPFAAAILDLSIRGGMGGVETFQQLRMLDPTFKALVSSGMSGGDIKQNYQAHGFSAIVSKPYEIATMAAALRDLLGAPTDDR